MMFPPTCDILFPPARVYDKIVGLQGGTPVTSEVRKLATPSVKDRVSAEEWDARVNLAACYRLAAHYRMTDLIYTHISARVPGPEHHFLINAFGLMWDEISASTLVKVTLEGEIVEDPAGSGINRAGYVIHSAVHRARADVECVMHTHTAAGIAVSAQDQGLLPISQHAMRFTGNIGYHDYEGLALERACQTQINAMAGGAKLRMPPSEIANKTANQFRNLPYKQKQTEWKAHLR